MQGQGAYGGRRSIKISGGGTFQRTQTIAAGKHDPIKLCCSADANGHVARVAGLGAKAAGIASPSVLATWTAVNVVINPGRNFVLPAACNVGKFDPAASTRGWGFESRRRC